MFLSIFISFFSVLISIMFFTLLERKVMAMTQFRKGPKRYLQALIDGLKLFKKEVILLSTFSNFFMSMVSITSIILCFSLWTFLYNFSEAYNILLMLLTVMQFLVFCWLMVSSLSKSKYSILAGIRIVSTKISYEILISTSFFLISLPMLKFSFTFSLYNVWFFLIFLFFWLVLVIGELSRSPFDFEEAESECVSGYNTDLSGSGFSMFILSEYSNLLFFSLFTSYVFGKSFFFFFFFLFLFTRCVFPRWRYDFLMYFCWSVLLYMFMLLLLFFLMLV